MLYHIVEQHLEEFFGSVSKKGACLPAFVRDEFKHHLR